MLANPLVESPRTSPSDPTGLGADTENRFFRWGWRTPQRTKNAADAVSGLSDPIADRAVFRRAPRRQTA
jgi:hypothetical protein